MVHLATPDPFDTSWMTPDEITLEEVDWPLFSRAWVHQELLLAPRTIHFGAQEVLWQCKSDFHKQSMLPKTFKTDPYSRLPASSLDDSKSILRERWYNTIEAYSWRQLTYPDDRLPAIAVMSREAMSVRVGDQYLGGLWMTSLLYDLAWASISQRMGLIQPNRSRLPACQHGHGRAPRVSSSGQGRMMIPLHKRECHRDSLHNGLSFSLWIHSAGYNHPAGAADSAERPQEPERLAAASKRLLP